VIFKISNEFAGTKEYEIKGEEARIPHENEILFHL